MSIQQIQQWLTEHSIETHISEEGVVLAKAGYINVFGNYNAEWVVAPTDLKGLREWMGY